VGNGKLGCRNTVLTAVVGRAVDMVESVLDVMLRQLQAEVTREGAGLY